MHVAGGGIFGHEGSLGGGEQGMFLLLLIADVTILVEFAVDGVRRRVVVGKIDGLRGPVWIFIF